MFTIGGHGGHCGHGKDSARTVRTWKDSARTVRTWKDSARTVSSVFPIGISEQFHLSEPTSGDPATQSRAAAMSERATVTIRPLHAADMTSGTKSKLITPYRWLTL